MVQHLSPQDKGLLVELLQRATPMPVVQIVDGMELAPGRVHVNPPHQDLSVRHDRLFLLAPTAPSGLHLPIDFFLRSLAEQQGPRSIGVVLSGMGSDGALGLRAIKERGGTTFVQSPDQARFDSMPRSALGEVQADFVAPASELPRSLIAWLRQPKASGEAAGVAAAPSDGSSLDTVVLLLRARTGHDFSLYKKNSLWRRIERRLGLLQLDRLDRYVSHLRENPQEIDLLFKELLIGVTRFFRDPELWHQLKTEVIPALLARQTGTPVLRAWVAACSTGEEAYSLAMVFDEAMQQAGLGSRPKLQIFATDLDAAAIDKARAGFYPANIIEDVGMERLQRYFIPKGNGFRVSSVIRDMVVFAPHNLVMDPPFTRLDLLSCRNLLIYLEPELQRSLLRLLHYSLKPGGMLVLGSAETAGDADLLFSTQPGRTRIFQRRVQTASTELASFHTIAPGNRLGQIQKMTPFTMPDQAPSLQTLVDAMLLQHFCPPALLTNEQGDIVYISGRTGKYLEPAAGKANLNVFAMAREGLGGELSAAFARAARDRTDVRLKSVAVGTEAGPQFVDLTVRPLDEPEALRGMMLIVLAHSGGKPDARKEDPDSGSADHRIDAMADELRHCRDELHLTRAQMQGSQQELMSANEELQSINEELTTSKEEMQSMNEELQTVNDELQSKVEALSQVNDDMNNLLNSTAIAALFLDDELRVRRFTHQTTSIIKLIPGDAGRPVTDLVTELEYPALADDVREVLRTLVFHECEVPARDG
ncbi:MAG: protein glutamate methylesterase CheB and methyltransferase CheR, partial [Pseudomonadota bacterium]